MLFDVVDRADVRMVQRGGRARLAAEPVERLGVAGDVLRQKLERDGPAEPGVFGLVDDTHPAVAEFGHDAVREITRPFI